MKSLSYQDRKTNDTNLLIKRILSALSGLKFGAVEITVHEGRIVQIERREKQRLNLDLPGIDSIEASSIPITRL
jgi:hypothetical protein